MSLPHPFNLGAYLALPRLPVFIVNHISSDLLAEDAASCSCTICQDSLVKSDEAEGAETGLKEDAEQKPNS
jgi:hypothetical protein